MAKSGAITPLRFAINILLRLVIVGIACVGLFNFYELVWIYDFVRPKTDAYTVMGGLLAPRSRWWQSRLLSQTNTCGSRRLSQSSRNSFLQRPVAR